jgi:hypothetical protein
LPGNDVVNRPPEDIEQPPVPLRLTVGDITSQQLVRHCALRPEGTLCYLDEMVCITLAALSHMGLTLISSGIGLPTPLNDFRKIIGMNLCITPSSLSLLAIEVSADIVNRVVEIAKTLLIPSYRYVFDETSGSSSENIKIFC